MGPVSLWRDMVAKRPGQGCELLRLRPDKERMGLSSNLQRAGRASEGQAKPKVRLANRSVSLWSKKLGYLLLSI